MPRSEFYILWKAGFFIKKVKFYLWFQSVVAEGEGDTETEEEKEDDLKVEEQPLEEPKIEKKKKKKKKRYVTIFFCWYTL